MSLQDMKKYQTLMSSDNQLNAGQVCKRCSKSNRSFYSNNKLKLMTLKNKKDGLKLEFKKNRQRKKTKKERPKLSCMNSTNVTMNSRKLSSEPNSKNATSSSNSTVPKPVFRLIFEHFESMGYQCDSRRKSCSSKNELLFLNFFTITLNCIIVHYY